MYVRIKPQDTGTFEKKFKILTKWYVFDYMYYFFERHASHLIKDLTTGTTQSVQCEPLTKFDTNIKSLPAYQNAVKAGCLVLLFYFEARSYSKFDKNKPRFHKCICCLFFSTLFPNPCFWHFKTRIKASSLRNGIRTRNYVKFRSKFIDLIFYARTFVETHK